MGTLYVVSTPVGNLEDRTLRSARILSEVDLVLAEDTRRTGMLLQAMEVEAPLRSLHRLNEVERTAEILDRLSRGDSLALVSDAGTPLVSDPGERLVDSVLEAGHTVVPIPGASAVLAALVASGFPPVPFTFLGFPPRKGADRERFLERVALAAETVICFEAPGRVGRLLDELAERVAPHRRASVARELTKLHEEIRRGTLEELARQHHETRPRGEFTVVIEPAPDGSDPAGIDEAAIRSLAGALLEAGESPSRTARQVARRLGLRRNDVYPVVQAMKGEHASS